ncbi:MAG: SDR family NAD(P)-dependent oxidoreductase, partial [Actinomycetota bacterium]
MSKTAQPLAGNVALVTGGGSGIGLGCARELVRDGAAVVLAARNVERLQSAATELRGLGEVHTVACDVTNEDSVQTACAAAQKVGPLTMVVANAGFGTGGPIHLTNLDDWNAIMAT